MCVRVRVCARVCVRVRVRVCVCVCGVGPNASLRRQAELSVACRGGGGQPGTQGALHTLCMRLRVPSPPPLRDGGNAKHTPHRL